MYMALQRWQKIRIFEYMKRIFLTAFFALVAVTAQAQAEGDTFHLVKKAGHYLFEAPVNGKEGATILVESGIPA